MAGWLGLAVAVGVADQLIKQLVLAMLHYGQVVPVTPFFDIVLLYNPGAAFSLLADQPGWQRWFFTILAVAICAWLTVLLRQHQHERLLPAAFALIIGGALGNVVDRLLHGAVVDYLHFYVGRFSWPAFNLADSAIFVGVALMLWGSFRHPANAPSRENKT
ncbi:lipoprotein signal peptidase [Pseudothauera nasutitermitis]|uniref:Lipoprotein signal peptidase n=2 Tax=Pseudothauera nasutitermitis TaxID=2565930 RepID=A0A4S4ARI7_9RHOO|nr:lipoprotein signal peptidase [Pseudothauera nasutitermitis]